MEIPAYQIHNVMKIYTKQLSQSKMIERQKSFGKESSEDKINISAAGKRQAIIDKVATDIVNRITMFGPQDEIEHEIVNKLQNEVNEHPDFQNENSSDFTFNVIDDNNNKKTNTLSMKNSSFLLNRLEQLAKEAVDKNMAM